MVTCFKQHYLKTKRTKKKFSPKGSKITNGLFKMSLDNNIKLDNQTNKDLFMLSYFGTLDKLAIPKKGTIIGIKYKPPVGVNDTGFKYVLLDKGKERLKILKEKRNNIA